MELCFYANSEQVFKLSPFILLLFLAAGHQGDHDGTVLGCLGDEILMDLRWKHNERTLLSVLSQLSSSSPGWN